MKMKNTPTPPLYRYRRKKKWSGNLPKIF